jgi:hypothetical protein
MWQKILDLIRNGETPIETAESGIPQIAVNAPVFELFQLLAALTAGYNKNVRRIKALRELAGKPFNHADENRLPEEKKEEERNTYNWVLCSERLPEKSDEFFTYGSNLGVCSMSLSTKYKAFNVHDHSEDASSAIQVTHWCEKPEAPVVSETEE